MKIKLLKGCYLYICLIIVFILTSGQCFSQFISNPSFEGPIGFSLLPPGWTVCDTMSTPDTEPYGENGVDKPASNGNTYLTLVGRTNPSPYAGHTEDVETKLLEPLLIGKCYKFQIDVYLSTTLYSDTWDGIFYYNNPMILKVYGENALCAKTELFYQSEPIANEDWETIEFYITPTISNVTYLYLQSVFVQQTPYFGNIQLDNIRLTEITPDDVIKLDTTLNYGETLALHASNASQYSWSPNIGLSCTDCQNPIANIPYSIIYTAYLTGNTICDNHKEYFIIEIKPFIPNIITPNGDGKNDRFAILGLEPYSSLTITNRMGEVLYQTDNYDNAWDGKYQGHLLQPDTYWYILKMPSSKEKIIGFIYLMK